MDIKQKIADLYARGAIQLSRKYCHVGVLPEGKTGLELMQEVEPRWVEEERRQLEQKAAENYIRCYGHNNGCIIELTYDEFEEWLRQKREREDAQWRRICGDSTCETS